jgi:transcriptional regulator with XRE-family HTH domain
VQISPTIVSHLREDRGLRISDLAKVTGLSPSYLSEIEAGKRDPSALVAGTVATALGVTVADLRGPLTCPNCGFALNP